MIVPQNKVSIVLNNQQWEQVPQGVHPATTTHEVAAKHEYSLRSISRKRAEKGDNKVTKTMGTREHSVTSALHEKLGGEHNETLRKKKVISQL